VHQLQLQLQLCHREVTRSEGDHFNMSRWYVASETGWRQVASCPVVVAAAEFDLYAATDEQPLYADLQDF